MLFVNYKITAPREEVLASLKDNNSVVESEKLEAANGRPKIHVKNKGDSIKIVCEMTDRSTRDRDFRVGTFMWGKLVEKDGVTSMRGVILTAPIYHLLLLALFGFFIYQCIALGGFSVIPICLVAFDVVMFWGEFKKQRIIKKFIFGAFRLTYQRLNPQKQRREIDNTKC